MARVDKTRMITAGPVHFHDRLLAHVNVPQDRFGATAQLQAAQLKYSTEAVTADEGFCRPVDGSLLWYTQRLRVREKRVSNMSDGPFYSRTITVSDRRLAKINCLLCQTAFDPDNRLREFAQHCRLSCIHRGRIQTSVASHWLRISRFVYLQHVVKHGVRQQRFLTVPLKEGPERLAIDRRSIHHILSKRLKNACRCVQTGHGYITGRRRL
jgi:hypothetical protein